ncbi:MAG: LCP family protein [bacterium]
MKKIVLTTLIVVVSIVGLTSLAISIASRVAILNVFLSLTPTAPMLAETNVLVLGVDAEGGVRSDTIMVLHINPEKRTAGLVSIPRDTLAILPGHGMDKINHSYAYGGVELARQTVQDFLRVNIPYYVIVNLTGIQKIIDDLGGVTVNVEKRMYYTDYAQNLFIDLYPGRQKLNGRQAMGYLRFRHTDNDFARIGRQQNFLHSVAGELMNKQNIFKTPGVFLSLFDCVHTNFSPREVLGVSLALRGAYELGNLNMTMISGTDLVVDGIYYLKANEAEVEKIVDKYLNGRNVASSG